MCEKIGLEKARLAARPVTLSHLFEYETFVRPITLFADSIETADCVDDRRCIALSMLRVAQPEQQLRLSKQCDLWAFVWTSSSVAADVVAGLFDACRHGSELRPDEPTLLEIGAGSGLCSVAAAAAGWRVTATDAVADALTLMQLNAARAGAEAAARFTTAQLDWHRGLSGSVLAASAHRFDLIVGADVLFLASNARPILTLLRDILCSDDSRQREPLPAAVTAEPPAAAGSAAAPDADSPATSHCPPVALLFDPGRPGREELESLASDYGLACERHDFASLPTAVALMRECSVLVLSPARLVTEGASSRRTGSADCECNRCCLRRAIPSALASLRSRRVDGVPSAAVAGGDGTTSVKPSYGYTLPSVAPA